MRAECEPGGSPGERWDCLRQVSAAPGALCHQRFSTQSIAEYPELEGIHEDHLVQFSTDVYFVSPLMADDNPLSVLAPGQAP